jgi:two-component system chemotaxis response regulator CheY
MANRTILIVDDSKTIRTSLTFTLTKEGYEVVAAEDGQYGIERLNELNGASRKPSMIITDINMPRMDGIEFIKTVKKIDEFKFIPIVVLSTESQDEKKMEGRKAGAAGWIVKPYTAESLIGVVRKFVK